MCRLQGQSRAAEHLGDLLRAVQEGNAEPRGAAQGVRRQRAQDRRRGDRSERDRRFDSRRTRRISASRSRSCTIRRTTIEKAYQTTGYPETFVIGPEGTIRKKWIGPDNWSSLGNRALIAQLLGLETPRPAVDRRSLSRTNAWPACAARTELAAASHRRGVHAAGSAQGDRGLSRRRAVVHGEREGTADRARARSPDSDARQLARAARSAAADSGDRRRLAEGVDQTQLEPADHPPPDQLRRAGHRS